MNRWNHWSISAEPRATSDRRFMSSALSLCKQYCMFLCTASANTDNSIFFRHLKSLKQLVETKGKYSQLYIFVPTFPRWKWEVANTLFFLARIYKLFRTSTFAIQSWWCYTMWIGWSNLMGAQGAFKTKIVPNSHSYHHWHVIATPFAPLSTTNHHNSALPVEPLPKLA